MAEREDWPHLRPLRRGERDVLHPRIGRRQAQEGAAGDYAGDRDDDFYAAPDWVKQEPGAPSFAGRGPKNYRRSDERIWEEVNDRLTAHPWVDASDIEVTVEDAVVRLTGSVYDRRSKRLAEDVAAEVMGVEDVHNDLRVRG